VQAITQKILDDSHVPYIRTEMTNSEAFLRVTSDVSKITVEDREKIDLIKSLSETEIDFPAIDALL